MAKSDKHKKLRKKEKAKIQLKGGLKTLGKAQNVIEPKLQTKKIVLREQLKSPADSGVVVTSRRKQSLAVGGNFIQRNQYLFMKVYVTKIHIFSNFSGRLELFGPS